MSKNRPIMIMKRESLNTVIVGDRPGGLLDAGPFVFFTARLATFPVAQVIPLRIALRLSRSKLVVALHDRPLHHANRARCAIGLDRRPGASRLHLCRRVGEAARGEVR